MASQREQLERRAELARTYSLRSYDDAWACVEDYDAVLEYAARNPDAGPTAVARALDLPRSRVRPWLDSTTPDPVRAIQTADARGWLDWAYADRLFRGLNALVAWVFSGGSINQRYVPYFAITGDDDRELLDRAAAAVDVELDFTRSATAQRAAELRPVVDASILGRVLSLLGAPVGAKNDRAPITMPAYLDEAPEEVRRDFAATYLHNRGQCREAKHIVTLRENRSDRYLDELTAFLGSITGGRVNRSGKNVILSTAATRQFADWPPVLGP